MSLFADAPIRARIRGTVLCRQVAGLVSVAVDADGVIVVPLDADMHAGVPIRVGYELIDGAEIRDGDELVIHLRGGEKLVAVGDARLNEVAAGAVARGRAMPELTRALRTLGGRRGGAGQDAFFRPLLQARRLAAAGGDVALDAFDADALRIAVEGELAHLAAMREPDRQSARRALEARLGDAAAPLLDALLPLTGARQRARQAGPAHVLRAWRDWAQVVHRVFERADAAWIAMRDVLETPPRVPPAKPRALDALWRRTNE